MHCILLEMFHRVALLWLSGSLNCVSVEYCKFTVLLLFTATVAALTFGLLLCPVRFMDHLLCSTANMICLSADFVRLTWAKARDYRKFCLFNSFCFEGKLRKFLENNKCNGFCSIFLYFSLSSEIVNRNSFRHSQLIPINTHFAAISFSSQFAV